MQNQCQTISGIWKPLSGIRNPCQFGCCASSLLHHRSRCVSTSFRFRIGWLEYNQCPEQRNGLQVTFSCSLSSSGGGACSLNAAAGKPLRLLWSNVPHFGHEGSYGGPRVASGGAWDSSFRSWPIGKVHSIFSFGCNIKAIKNVTRVKAILTTV